ncbi:S1C family serine protease [Lentibacillus sp. Marseille-P4043]|uniref:S1C family serine protease n=1 Tax=Lentibacillus sp. Marseille-P4043 TaxID=2040293 RepID=UPI000D0AE258|nr:serine protease [Lentibacillus sp. Marseille-P4043]
MNHREQNDRDGLDDDLYEEIEEDELLELVEKERVKALKRAQEEKNAKPKHPFPKWAFWLIAFVMVFNVVALLPKTFSIPAIDFLLTSAKLSTQDNISDYKQSIVVVETGESKGTGFAISADGTILTNHHVIEGEESVTVTFPDDGFFKAEVVADYPDVDLAVLQTDGKDLPHLDLAQETTFKPNESIYFIGNPLRFHGIANKGTIIGYTQLDDWDEQVVMMKAPVYRGNSGSPVINEQGNVIGVVFATLDDKTHGKVGLFIPIDYFYEADE